MPRIVHEWAEPHFLMSNPYRIVHVSETSYSYVLEHLSTDAMGTPCWKIVDSVSLNTLFDIIGPMIIRKNIPLGSDDGGCLRRYDEGMYEYTHTIEHLGFTLFKFKRNEHPIVSYSLETAEKYQRINTYKGDAYIQGVWDETDTRILFRKNTIDSSTRSSSRYGNSTFLRLASIIDYLKGI